MKNFNEFINENSDSLNYYKSFSYEIGQNISEYFDEKFGIETNTLSINYLIEYTETNGLDFSSFKYFGIRFKLKSLKDMKMSEYKLYLNFIEQTLNEFDPIDILILNGSVFAIYKINEKISNFGKSKGIINKYNL